MRETLTQTARAVLDAAQQEARNLNQEYVGAEHILLALLADSHTPVGRILRRAHLDLDAARSMVRQRLAYADEAPGITGALPMSPLSKKLFNNAVVLARSLRENAVSSRFLLLAILQEPGAAGFAKVLEAQGVDPEALRRSLSEKPAEPEP
jgi:ATP-dependent Clp protease ATP-binding subunit ClpC